MTKKRLSSILIDALSDRLNAQQQVELRNAVETIETANKSVGDTIVGGRHLSRVSMGNIVLSYGEGLTIVNPSNGKTTVILEPDGDSRFGSDLSNVGKTSFSIFANAQKYNGENIGDGDVLLGDNSPGKANLLWDRSEGRLNFRGGLNVNAYIDTDGTLHATGATISGTITAVAGAIGGWTIGATFLKAGSGSNTVGLDSGGSNPAIYAGSATPGSAPFRVTQAGALTATSGNIAGWTITSTQIAKTGILLDSSLDQIIVGAAAPRLVLDGPNKRVRTSTYTAGFQGFSLEGATGDAEFNNITARGELRTTVLTYSELLAHAGTLGVFKSAGKLKNDCTTVNSPTTFNVDIEDPDSGHVQLFSVSDVLWLKDATHSNYVTVQSVSDQTTFYRYVCVLGSGTATTFRAGAAVADYGQSNAGFLLMTADDPNGPFYSVRTWVTNPWTGGNITERARLGNMKNAFGTGANNRYGFGVGDYAGGNYLSYNAETANTFIIKAGGGVVLLDGSGITITTPSSQTDNNTIKFKSGSTMTHSIYNYNDPSFTVFDFHGYAVAGKNTSVAMTAETPTGKYADVILYAISGLNTSSLMLHSNDGATDYLEIFLAGSGYAKVFGSFQATGRGTFSDGVANAETGIGQDPIHTGYAGFWNNTLTRTAQNYCLIQNASGNSYLNGQTGVTLQIANASVISLASNLVTFGQNVALGTNSILSSDPIACRAYKAAAQSVASGSWVAINLDTETLDTDGIHDTVTNNTRLTATRAGLYMITGVVQFASNATGMRGVAIRLGGSTFIATQIDPAMNGNAHQTVVSCLYYLAATNYVEMIVYQNSGSPLNVDAANGSPAFSMARIA